MNGQEFKSFIENEYKSERNKFEDIIFDNVKRYYDEVTYHSSYLYNATIINVVYIDNNKSFIIFTYTPDYGEVHEEKIPEEFFDDPQKYIDGIQNRNKQSRIAYYKNEIERCEKLINIYSEKIKEQENKK